MDAYIGFADGKMVLGSNSKLPESYDPRTRPWYKKAIKEGKVSITDAYQDATTKKIYCYYNGSYKMNQRLLVFLE